jgi:hypothetical protein
LINRYTFHALGWAKRKDRNPHFHYGHIGNHAGTAFGSRWHDPTSSRKAILTPLAWGTGIVEGFTFTDAIGRAGGESSEERLASGEEGALDG